MPSARIGPFETFCVGLALIVVALALALVGYKAFVTANWLALFLTIPGWGITACTAWAVRKRLYPTDQGVG